MNERTSNRRPRLVPHLAALMVVAGGIGLAMWQLDRADWKADLLADWETAEAEELARLDTDEAGRFVRVTATGQFDVRRHVLLDNQTRNLQPGVHVFTPFLPEGSERVWMVNRGWQPMPRRDHLPAFPTPEGSLDLAGRISDPPRVGVQIGQAAQLDPEQWPNLMTYFDVERIREVLGDEVADRVILLDPDHPAHLSGDQWQPVTFGPERHRAYAFQWFSIALVVFVIWLVLTIKSFRNP